MVSNRLRFFTSELSKSLQQGQLKLEDYTRLLNEFKQSNQTTHIESFNEPETVLINNAKDDERVAEQKQEPETLKKKRKAIALAANENRLQAYIDEEKKKGEQKLNSEIADHKRYWYLLLTLSGFLAKQSENTDWLTIFYDQEFYNLILEEKESIKASFLKFLEEFVYLIQNIPANIGQHRIVHNILIHGMQLASSIVQSKDVWHQRSYKPCVNRNEKILELTGAVGIASEGVCEYIIVYDEMAQIIRRESAERFNTPEIAIKDNATVDESISEQKRADKTNEKKRKLLNHMTNAYMKNFKKYNTKIADYDRYRNHLHTLANFLVEHCDNMHWFNIFYNQHFFNLIFEEKESIKTDFLELMEKFEHLITHIPAHESQHSIVRDIVIHGLQLASSIVQSKDVWHMHSNEEYVNRKEKILALSGAVTAASDYIKDQNDSKKFGQVVTTTIHLRRTVEGPAILQNQNRFLRGFLGAMGILVGAGLITSGVFLLPFCPPAFAVLVLAGALIGATGILTLAHAITGDNNKPKRELEMVNSRKTASSLFNLFTLLPSRQAEIEREIQLLPDTGDRFWRRNL